MITPKKFHTQIQSLRWLSKKAFELELVKPPEFEYLAGQYITVGFKGKNRDYSLISAPHEQSLAFCVRKVEAGAVSSELSVLKKGAELFFTGPHGYFTFMESALKPVFVATGTGIAPFVSMARAGARGFVILHGVSTEADLYYRDEFSESAQFYIPCLPKGKKGPPGTFFGTVTAYLANEFPKDIYAFYLCGGGEMIRDVIRLIDERFTGSLVHWENFF